MKLSRLRGRKVALRVRNKGAHFRGKHMNMTYIMGMKRVPMAEKEKDHPAAPTGIFIGTGASTKLEKSAVKRNRMRRRCREALRISLQEHATLPSCQLIITPRSSSLSCDFSELKKDIENFIQHLQRQHGLSVPHRS